MKLKILLIPLFGILATSCYKCYSCDCYDKLDNLQIVETCDKHKKNSIVEHYQNTSGNCVCYEEIKSSKK